MFCVCAQRRTHTLHPNSAIQRRHLELFKANQTQRADEKVLRINTPREYSSNLCRKTFFNRFARQGSPLWNAKFLGPMEPSSVVSQNIIMPTPRSNEKPMDDDSSSDEDREEAWEWRRLYLADDLGFWDLLCCPEDVARTAGCSH